MVLSFKKRMVFSLLLVFTLVVLLETPLAGKTRHVMALVLSPAWEMGSGEVAME